MTVARREHFQSLLEPGLRKIFYDVYNKETSMLPELFNMQTTSNPYETDVSIGTMGEFKKFEGTVEYDRPYEGYTATYEFPEFAKGFMVERKMFDDQRYAVINKKPASLALAAFRRRETDGAAIFNNAFTTTGPDGVPLCATNHPSPAPDGPAARSNMSTYQLGHAALRNGILKMRSTLDDRGGRIPIVPDTILVPAELEEKAWELVTAEGKLATNHPGTNPNIHQGKLKVVVWDYLTDPDVWFLIDSRFAKMFLNWFDRVKLEFAAAEDFDTLVAKYRAYMRYNAGWSDWVWVYGNTGEDIHAGDATTTTTTDDATT